MFAPTDRCSLLDILRPPPRYRLDTALGTTYSLDFVVLTAVMLAFVDGEPEATDNTAETLRSITRLSERVRIFVNRGGTKTYPNVANRVSSMFDAMVREVSYDVGCFHPKIWLARYEPRQVPGSRKLPPVVRLVCASRNLSASPHWEAYVGFEGVETDQPANSKLAAQVRSFVQWLSNKENDRRLMPLINALRRTEFATSRECRDDLNFWWQSPGGQHLLDAVPVRGKQALLLSPFVRKTFLERVMDRFEQLTLISTQRELDQIRDEEFHRRLSKHQVYVIREKSQDVDIPSMDLHAKVLAFEGAFGTRTFVGSANASDSAWCGRNCEAVVSFSPGIRVERFRKEFLFDSKGILQGWIEQYQRRAVADTTEDISQRKIDELRRALGLATIHASYSPETSCLTLTASRVEALKEVLESDQKLGVKACPLPLLDSTVALQPVANMLSSGLKFTDIPVADLSKFIAFELTHAELPEPTFIVLNACIDYDELLAARDAALLKRLLTRDKFTEFLAAILFDASRRSASRNGHGNSTNGAAASLFFGAASLEDVLESCTEDPSRAEEIDRLLKTFADTGFVDPAFKDFWQAFRSVLVKTAGGSTNG